jgi:hypothetical protein
MKIRGAATFITAITAITAPNTFASPGYCIISLPILLKGTPSIGANVRVL